MAKRKSNTKKSSRAKASGEGGLSIRGIALHMAWMVGAFGCLIWIASLVSFDPYDRPSHAAAPLNETATNWCGPVGAYLAYKSYLMLGIGVWVCVAGAVTFIVAKAMRKTVDQLALRIIGLLLMAIAVSGFAALIAPQAGSMPEGNGGWIAIYAVNELSARFSTLGTLLVLCLGFGVGATLAVDSLVVMLPVAMAAMWRGLCEVNWPKPVLIVDAFRNIHMPRWGRSDEGGAAVADAEEEYEYEDEEEVEDDDEWEYVDEYEDEEEEYEEEEIVAEEPKRKIKINRTPGKPNKPAKADKPNKKSKAAKKSASLDGDESAAEPEANDADAASKEPLSPEQLREKMRNLPISLATRTTAPPPVAPVQDLSGYKFPPIEMLEEPESNFSDEMADTVREQAEILETALQTYRIEAEVVAIDAGPVITLYEVQLAPGVKVNSINNVASDLARELKAQNIRVVPNTAGKSTVGIEVPNIKKEKVRLKELMALGGQQVFDKMALPMFLGKDASGNPLISDLAAMPHMLIAGTTGSGKSVCINSIIMSFLFARRPDELKLILVDPKMVEMAQFRDIPHLMCPVVTEMGKAAAILEWCVTQMEERYALLAEAGVRNLDTYNKMSWEDLKDRFDPQTPEEEAKIPKKLARYVFVIDELADLMMTHKEVESFIVRIAQKARAVGIHLILATQRPQANVVTGLIKSNMPCRVCMKVSSGMDSRIVLDSKGGELLLGHGDMLYLSPHTGKTMRAQGTLVDDTEVRQCVKFLKNVAGQSFEPQLVQLKAPGLGETDEEKDDLFDAAVDVLVETRRGSVSLLQRRLSIGYSRASRLVEQMGQAGILGEYKGSQAREVMITSEDWEMMKAQLAADTASYTDAAPAGGVREISGGASVETPNYNSDVDADPVVADEVEDADDGYEAPGATDVDVEPTDVEDELVEADEYEDGDEEAEEEYEEEDEAEGGDDEYEEDEEEEEEEEETEEEAELRRIASGEYEGEEEADEEEEEEEEEAEGGDDEYEEYEYVEEEEGPA